jgi:hypothetical protein
MTQPLELPEIRRLVEATKDHLVESVIYLSEASKWAQRDYFSFNPAAVLAWPLKHWKLRKARRELAAAQALLRQLADHGARHRAWIDAQIELSWLATMFDVVGGGLIDSFAEIYIAEQIETSLSLVNGLLAQVGEWLRDLRQLPA